VEEREFVSPRIIVDPSGITFEAAAGCILGDALVAAGFPISLYCGKRGICGKCFIEILAGDSGSVDDYEDKLRIINNLGTNFRLSCRYIVKEDLKIRIPPSSLLVRTPVFEEGSEKSLALDPALKKIAFRPGVPSLLSPESYLDILREKWSDRDLLVASESVARLAPLLIAPPENGLTAVTYSEREILDLEPGDTSGRAHGLAVDLGTTTVVVEIVDLLSGRVLGKAAGWNRQSAFGADVVSRMAAAYRDARLLEDLRAAARRSINDLVRPLLAENGLGANDIYEAVVAGNTAMSHLFLGISVDSLAVAPFASVFSVLPPLSASASGLEMNPRGRVYLAPNLRSFVGGDITAGLTASGLIGLPGNLLYVDLGTNGEVAVKTDRGLIVTSTAAGPAFEGMSLSCGMLAIPGAISGASLDRGTGRIDVETVGGAPPLGVCGTGLIDLAAAFLEAGRLTPSGRIVGPPERLMIANGLGLGQQDVRELQLAAAALKTGIRMLLEAERIAVPDLDGIFVAGAFGAALKAENAMRLGLLPRVAAKIVKIVGNASLAGARAFLLSREERRRGEEISRNVRHFALAKDGTFQEKFIAGLELSEWT
jgi:uncharacterized 2Fe-2S/4Fe-4S cluster protein (DUF4445 family)